MNFAIKTVAASVLLASAGGAFSQSGETVKIAWLDPLSGLMAAVGTNQLKSWQFMAEEFNKKNAAGVKYEIIGIDNKLSPQETTSALRSAMDQGARYVVQGNGSGPALAIMDALEKHNARNPGKEVLFLNYAAVDPDLTNSKCSYWHFRLDADTSMKMEALTTYMKDQKEIKKVYLINQNYSHGHQVSKYAKEMLKRKRPDVEIVGDDLSPLAQVRDFSPYIAKIKQSGADTVITGNWGSDLALLIKAANDAGLNNVNFYTYYGAVTGSPTAMGAGAAGRVYMVAYAHANLPGEINRIVVEQATHPEALNAIAAPIRKALIENRRTEVMYHVGRPGHDGYMDRVLQAWGVDGEFSRGDVVEIRDGSGRVHGRGLVNYDAGDCRQLIGRQSAEIASTLGWRGYDALITRDNLVLSEV